MSTFHHQTGDVTVTRPQRRPSRGQLAARVIGAIVVGVVAGWIAYLMLNPGDVTTESANVATMSSQELGAMRSAAMAERLSEAGSFYGVPSVGVVDPLPGYASLSSQELGAMRSAAMAERLSEAGSFYGVPGAGTVDPLD
ncbi:MAG: hypothetical protein U9R51_01190 [Actinomycetota bacterium]|nr:hypothetical protein [Actinomycetota bacterium]